MQYPANIMERRRRNARRRVWYTSVFLSLISHAVAGMWFDRLDLARPHEKVEKPDEPEVIQIAFGWEGCHMHQFVTKAGRHYSLPPDSDDPSGQDLHGLDETTTRIRDVFEQLKERLAYEYDFGDGWVHGVKLIATHEDGGAFPALPLCLGGERAAPPEDCGGLWGFYEKLQIVHEPDPDDEWHQDVLEWMGDYEPEKLDIESANRDLKQCFR